MFFLFCLFVLLFYHFSNSSCKEDLYLNTQVIEKVLLLNDVVLLHGAYLRQRDNVKQTLFFF